MSALATLVQDVDLAIRHGSDAMRARTLASITDLLVREDGRLGPDQVELFDDVLGRFNGSVGADARAQLAERVADLRHGPPILVRSLAYDEQIAVAEPVLARSRQLDDQDLMGVAASRPSAHRLAICRRPAIAECVTDVLVSEGGQDVRSAVAANPGARLSDQGGAILVESARDDEALQISLGERHDLSAMAMHQLIAVTRDLARRQMVATLAPEEETPAEKPIPAGDGPDLATATPARAGGRDYRRAAATIRDILGRRALAPSDLLDFATAGRPEETICVVAALAGLPVSAAERICDGDDSETLMLLAKAHGWTWPCFARLVLLFSPDRSVGRRLRLIEARFAGLTSAKARRILTLRHVGSAAFEPPRAFRPIRPA